MAITEQTEKPKQHKSIKIVGSHQIIVDDKVYPLDAYMKEEVMVINKIEDLVRIGKVLGLDRRVKTLSKLFDKRLLKEIDGGVENRKERADFYYDLRKIKDECGWLLDSIETKQGMMYLIKKRFILLDLKCIIEE